MTSQILALSRLAIRWEIWGKPIENDWESEASVLMSGYPGYQAIEWVDPSMHARWIAPLIGNGADEDLDFTVEPRRRTALDTAEAMRDVVVTRPINLRQGGRGFLVCVPIFSGKVFEGFIVGVFRYQQLLDRVLNNVAADYWVAVYDGGEAVYKRADNSQPAEKRWFQQEKIILGVHSWDVFVWPKAETLAQAESPLPTVSLIVGFFVAGLLASIVYSAQTSQLRARKLIAANRQTEKRNRGTRGDGGAVAAGAKDGSDWTPGRRRGPRFQQFADGDSRAGHAFAQLVFPPPPLRRNLEGILKAAERATTLTRQLLAFSRKQVLQPKVLDLNSLVAQVAELLPPLIGEDIRSVCWPRIRTWGACRPIPARSSRCL